jgi:hypothetical protein
VRLACGTNSAICCRPTADSQRQPVEEASVKFYQAKLRGCWGNTLACRPCSAAGRLSARAPCPAPRSHPPRGGGGMDVVSRQQAVQRLDGRIIEGKLGNYHLTTEWLGGGSSANVFLAMNDSTSERVAVKAIDRDSLECSERKQTLLMRELNITTKLHHPNIINLMEVIFDQNYVMLVMEFAAGGELYNAVKVRGGHVGHACLPACVTA